MTLEYPAIVSELAELAAKHKLVPFFGAGVSLGHVSVDWDQISKVMADKLGVPLESNPEIAQKYVDTYTKKGLCELLNEHLLINEYSDKQGASPLAVMCLGTGTVYTTNQDNVFEVCAKKYGREYKKIVDLSDLAESWPGNYLLIKYHGDLSKPDSVVFTTEDYEERIKDQEHFLNIRLRSDLLAKNFLFLGYSFRDPNIQFLFRGLSEAFGGNLPSSYLVAFHYSEEFRKFIKEFGVTLVVPSEAYPEIKNEGTAFEKFLADLTKATVAEKIGEELSDLFEPKVPPSRRVVTEYEISALEKMARKSGHQDAVKGFRVLLDGTLIPSDLEAHVVDIYSELAKRCSCHDDSYRLENALFNLHLSSMSLVKCLACCLTTGRYRENRGGFSIFRPITPDLPEEVLPFAAAMAIHLLRDWNCEVNDLFRKNMMHWMQGYESLPEKLQEFVRKSVNSAWVGERRRENPLKRLSGTGLGRRSQTYTEIRSKLGEMIPKQFKKPVDD